MKVVPVSENIVEEAQSQDGQDVDMIVDAVELDPKEKAKQEKEAEKQKMQEFGKPVSFRTLCSLATWPEIFVYAMGWVGAFAHGAAAPALCLIFGNMLDGFGSSEMVVDTEKNARDFCIIGASVILAGTIQEFAFPWFAERVTQRAAPLYFDAALHKDIGWFDVHEVGAFPAEMNQDLENLTEALSTKVGIAVMASAQLVLGFALGFWKGWLLALIMSAGMPLMGVGVALMGGSMEEIQQESQSYYAKAATVAEEVLYAVRTVVSFGGEKREIARFKMQVEKSWTGGVRSRSIAGAGMGYVWLVMFASYALAFYAGMRLRYDEVKAAGGEVYSIGTILVVFFAILTGGFSIGQIPPGFICISKGRVSGARMFHIIKSRSVIQCRAEDIRKEIKSIDSLELKEVHFAYPARPEMKVLQGLTLNIEKGQKVAVVGESGSGKSTVMALLERFYDPLVGAVLVNGIDLRGIAVKSYRKQIGYVGQEPVLFATSVKENILQGCMTASSRDVERVAEEARVMEFVGKLPDKINTYVGSGGSQFSGGQKQRIAIARALIKSPSLLFLDEATSALDSKSEKMIQDTIDAISGKHDRIMTIVSIAHRLSTVRNSDIIYVLSQGAVAEQGAHDDLMSRQGLYHALAATQMSAEAEEPKLGGPGDANNAVEENADDDNKDFELQRATSGDNNDRKDQMMQETDDEKKREKEINKTYKVPMWRLLDYCKPQWGLFVPGVIGAGINGASMPLVGGVILSQGMNAFFDDDKDEMREEIERVCIYFLIGGIACLVGNFMQGFSFGVIAESITLRLRVLLLTTVLRQEIGFHDNPEHTPGKLCRAFQVYANRISNFTSAWGAYFAAFSNLAAGLVIAFYYAWRMALAILITVPFLGVAQGVQMEIQMGAQKSDNKALQAAQQVVSDAISNGRTVHACGNEKDLVKLYTTLLKALTTGSFKKHLLGGFVFGLTDSLQYFVMAAGFWWMAFIIDKKWNDFSESMSAFMGLMFAAMGAGMAASMTGDMAKAKVAAHDLFKLLDREPLIDGLEPSGASPAADDQIGRIEFEGVQFHYPFRTDVQVLKDVRFTVERGTSVGLVGPSGGGKSTVMAMLQRFYDPQNGAIFVGSSRTQLSDINIRWWRKQVGFVGQEPILFDGTVLYNVKYGLEANEMQQISAERLAECKRMSNLNFIDSRAGNAQGWETEVGPRGNRLSGGQKQRVAICRALVRNPPILLLDEATSALDTQSEKVVGEALEAARAGRTSFSIAHRLSTIQGCDTIMVVGEGRILESGTHEELMDKGEVYYKLHEASQKRA